MLGELAAIGEIQHKLACSLQLFFNLIQHQGQHGGDIAHEVGEGGAFEALYHILCYCGCGGSDTDQSSTMLPAGLHKAMVRATATAIVSLVPTIF
jgi:hypothetical protein